MPTITLPATLENMDTVIAFVDQQLEPYCCPMEIQFQIDVAVEEMYVNIAHYAYTDRTGEACISCHVEEGTPPQAVIELRDSGTPYNPLARQDPDVSLSAEERAIGGLGIFMVKKSMDQVDYRHEDGFNILTMRKSLSQPQAE